MFGWLHIELASLRSIGTLPQDSVCTSAICEEMWRHLVLLNLSWLPQVSHEQGKNENTACSLHNLMEKAYQDYYTDEPWCPPLGLEDWCVQRRRARPQFQFWNLVLDMELAMLFTMIRSFREENRKMWKVCWASTLQLHVTTCQQ